MQSNCRKTKTWLVTLMWQLKKQLCVVGVVAMCFYSEISTCGLGLGLGVLASFNVHHCQKLGNKCLIMLACRLIHVRCLWHTAHEVPGDRPRAHQ